jgi:uridine kinase
MVKIIGISGIGGAGKSVLTNALGKSLNATIIFWDDFDEISKDPEDLIKWYNSTQDYSEWKYDSLAEVLKELKTGKKIICPATKKELIPTQYIVFDAPLGRRHSATGQYIDYSIFLNTPLDVALVRRVLRDFRDKSNLNITEIFEELDFYLTSARPLYEMNYEKMELSDYIADGNQPIDKLVASIVKQIKKERIYIKK